MASIVFNSCIEDVLKGNIDFDTDTFYGMIVTSSYTPDKDAHTKRSDVTNEIVGTGYTAGGDETVVTVTPDDANDRVDVEFGDISWPGATFTGRGIVIYKARGGASSADELVAYVDWGSDKSATAATFIATFTSALRFQNS